jgi:carboxymethylenebutenolidase
MTTFGAVTLATDDGPMPGYQARPDGAAKGGVIVVQEAFGVNPHIEDVTRRFAAAGWDAVAPAFFHRQGSPVLDYDDLATVMPLLGQMTAAGLAMDLTAAVDHLAAALHPLGAAVTFYGGGVAQGRFGLPSLVDLAPQLQTPWLGHFGDHDRGIPVAEVEALRAATDPLGVPTGIFRYADADHGFHCDARPAVFHPAAAGLAWPRTLDWLDQHAGA